MFTLRLAASESIHETLSFERCEVQRLVLQVVVI